jgi:hypothetical protein
MAGLFGQQLVGERHAAVARAENPPRFGVDHPDDAVLRRRGVDGKRRGGDLSQAVRPRLLVRQRSIERELRVAVFGDVAEDQDRAEELVRRPVDGRGRAAGSDARAVARDEQRVVREPDGSRPPAAPGWPGFHRLPRVFVDDPEHLLERRADGLAV